MTDSALWATIFSILLIGWVIYIIFKSGYDDKKYRAEGIKVEAKIINKKNIGASGTGNMKFYVELEFPTNDGIVITHAKRFFTPEDMVKILRNNTVSLYYLPEDPKKVYLVPGDME